MTATELSATAGIVLSLFFSYAPKVKDWFAWKDPTTKRLIMLVLLAVLAAGALLYKCGVADAVCITANWHEYAVAFVTAAITNQTTYQLTPLPADKPAQPAA